MTFVSGSTATTSSAVAPDVRATPARTIAASVSAPARDGRHDGHGVARLQGGGLLLQETDVLVVHEDAHVAAQVAGRVAQPVLQALVLAFQPVDDAGDVLGLDLDGVGAAG